MKTAYITDGSFEGLLSAIHSMYYTKDDVCDIFSNTPIQMDFSCTYKNIETDGNKAHDVYSAICKKISHKAAYAITMTWLSELPQSGKMIKDFIKLGFQVGKSIDNMLTHEYVLPVLKAAQKVSTENQLMLGLCRFSKTYKNYYLCRISPDHNILPLISPHFAARLSNQRWIIADTARDLASIYDGEKWYIVSEQISKNIPYSEDELQCRALWKKYFNAVAIAGRRNPKLQRNMMPVRYWKNLIEFN